MGRTIRPPARHEDGHARPIIRPPLDGHGVFSDSDRLAASTHRPLGRPIHAGPAQDEQGALRGLRITIVLRGSQGILRSNLSRQRGIGRAVLFGPFTRRDDRAHRIGHKEVQHGWQGLPRDSPESFIVRVCTDGPGFFRRRRHARPLHPLGEKFPQVPACHF